MELNGAFMFLNVQAFRGFAFKMRLEKRSAGLSVFPFVVSFVCCLSVCLSLVEFLDDDEFCVTPSKAGLDSLVLHQSTTFKWQIQVLNSIKSSPFFLPQRQGRSYCSFLLLPPGSSTIPYYPSLFSRLFFRSATMNHPPLPHSGWKLNAGDEFFSNKKPLSRERGSERSEWAVRANGRTDKRVAQYSMSLFLNHSAPALSIFLFHYQPHGVTIHRQR